MVGLGLRMGRVRALKNQLAPTTVINVDLQFQASHSLLALALVKMVVWLVVFTVFTATKEVRLGIQETPTIVLQERK